MLKETLKSGITADTKLTGTLLVAANLLPLIGVFAWGWSVYEIVILYWAENVILGVINIFRMAFAAKGGGGKFFMIPFFAVHYGFFCTIHGFFIKSILGNDSDFDIVPVIGLPSMVGDVYDLTGWALVALAVSHGFSFLWNYLGKGEFKTANIGIQMFAPYGRIALLHVAILIGAIIAEFFGAPIWMLIILIGGKIAMDLGIHFLSHIPKTEKTDEKA